MITIKTYLLDRFFKSNWNFTSEHVKLVKIPARCMFEIQFLFSKFLKLKVF